MVKLDTERGRVGESVLHLVLVLSAFGRRQAILEAFLASLLSMLLS